MILEFDKPETLFYQDVRLAAVAFEETLQILFSAARGQITYVNSATSRHSTVYS